jgi:hypothetical protein
MQSHRQPVVFDKSKTPVLLKFATGIQPTEAPRIQARSDK